MWGQKYMQCGVDVKCENCEMAANIGQSVANSLLMVANLFSTLKITKLSVPELVQTNSSVTLDCEYTALDDQVTLQWLFNQRPVYLWRPGQAPMVSGVLEGRIDDGYKVSGDPKYEYRALRLATLEPELSGDYTCVVQKNGSEDRQTKSMLVFSPEHEFVLAVSHNDENLIEINCIARGIYPQPNMVLERNRDLIAKQDQRVWRNGSLYDSGCQARVTRTELRERDRITCRLELPQAGYTAMREKQIHLEDLNQCHNKNNSTKTNMTCANGASIPRRMQINVYIIFVLINQFYDCTLM